MGGMKVSNMDFIKLLPAFMQDDEAAIALSKAVNKLIGEPGKRLATIRTWDKVDELTEAECNEMAWELDIDWYDSEGMSLTEKRNTIKLAQQIKRKRGTKWAVERLIGAYFGEGYVMEWFEMDGSPYTFAALTTNANTDGENFNKFVDAVQAAKNVRSHIAGVFYYWQQGPDPGIECALNTELHRYDFAKCGTNPRTATIGFVIKPSIETDPEVKPYLYGYTHAGTTTCGTYPQPGTLGAVVKQAAAAETVKIQISRNMYGRVKIVPICAGGQIPSEDVLADVLAACSADDVRPLTDMVTVEAPETHEYDIELTYYTTKANESEVVQNMEGSGGAIDQYINWQGSTLNQDINPDELRKRILCPDWADDLIGATRVQIIKPEYTELNSTTVAKFSGKKTVKHIVKG